MMASPGPGPSIAGTAEFGPAELEGLPLREVQMENLQSFIRLAFAAPGLVSGDYGRGRKLDQPSVAPGGDRQGFIRLQSIRMIQIICS